MSRKTRERKLREIHERDRQKKEYRRHWKHRLARRLLKALTVFVFFCYLGLAAPLTYTWFKTKWVRLEPLEDVGKVAQRDLYGTPQDPEAFRTWLSLRKEGEGQQLIKLLDPYVGRMSGMTFLLYGVWDEDAGKMEDAVFWRQYARFRVRYDALRCGSYDAIGLITDIMGILPKPDAKEQAMETPENLPKIMRRILDYDLDHPPQNDPDQFCKALTATEQFRNKLDVDPATRAEWPGIHGTLRGITYYEIVRMEAEQRVDAADKASGKNGDASAPPEADKAEKPCPKGSKTGTTKDGKPCRPPKAPAKP